MMRLTFAGAGQEIGLTDAFEPLFATGSICSRWIMNEFPEIRITPGQGVLGAQYRRSIVARVVAAGFFKLLRVGHSRQSELQISGRVVSQPGFRTAFRVGHDRVDGVGIQLEVAVRKRGFGFGTQGRIGKVRVEVLPVNGPGVKVLGRVGFSGHLSVRSAGRVVGHGRNRVASFPAAGHFPRFRHDLRCSSISNAAMTQKQ